MRELLQGADIRITRPGEGSLVVARGTVLVYVAPFAGETEDTAPGRRLFLAECTVGTVIPDLFYTDEEGTLYRFLITAREEAVELEIRSDLDPARVRAEFALAGGIPHAERLGFEEAVAELYRMHQVRDDAYIYRADRDRIFYEEEGQRRIDRRLHKNAAEQRGRSRNPLYLALFRLCEEQGMQPPSPEKTGAGQSGNPPIPQVLDRCGIVWRRIPLTQIRTRDRGETFLAETVQDHRVVLVRKTGGGEWRLLDPDSGSTLCSGQDAADRIREVYRIIPPLPDTAGDPGILGRYIRSRIRPSEWLLAGAASALTAAFLVCLLLLLHGYHGTPLLADCAVAGTAAAAAWLTARAAFAGAGERIGYRLQAALYHRAFSLPQALLADTDSACLAELTAGAGCRTAREQSGRILGGFLAAPLLLCGCVGMISVGSTAAAVVLSVEGVLFLLFLSASGGGVRARSACAKLRSGLDSELYQDLRGVSKIRTAGASAGVLYRYIRGLLDFSLQRDRAERFSRFRKLILFGLWFVSPPAVLLLSGTAFGPLAQRQAMLFLAGGVLFSAGISAAAILVHKSRIQEAAAAPLCRLLSVPGEDAAAGSVPEEVTGRIDIDHLTFTRPGEETPVLNDISVHIAPGEYIGIAGSCGSGKSTLLGLLLGFLTPERGRIYYDHRDLEALDKRVLRREMGVVLQDDHLISGSIADNLAVRDPELSEKRMWELLESVGMKETVEAMPMGLMTMLDGESPALSGGEMQRLILARALSAHPKILILDEPTSALDDITQRRICDTIKGLSATRIVVAHRSDTLADCDRILVLDKGRIIKQGKPEEVL